MKQNVGPLDRVMRALMAITVGILYFLNALPGFVGNVLLVIACLLLATSIIGICPIYRLLGMNTKTGTKKYNS